MIEYKGYMSNGAKAPLLGESGPCAQSMREMVFPFEIRGREALGHFLPM